MIQNNTFRAALVHIKFIITNTIDKIHIWTKHKTKNSSGASQMTKYVFRLPDSQQITSLVMSQNEFDELCQHISKLKIKTHDGEQIDQQNLETIRKAKHLKLMARGTTTEQIFKKYEIQTEFLSAIVRGHGLTALTELDEQQGITTIASDQAFRQQCEETYNILPIEAQQDINSTILKLIEAAKQQTPVESLITSFIGRHGKELQRGVRISLAEQAIAAMYQTHFLMQQANNPIEEFNGYLKRLLTGIIQTCRQSQN